ncbi:SDR family NAD(P)-dependent oxidoreductase [Brevibacillus borstelensis]|uniref:SDR family NAD(P)-dependent oxidoreductase n=1 Tax=Brevibacillus borstelensis TaxID=45462 RepID=UPI002E1AFE9F|nr:SDR family NAD(P)-dependent oxidoreductase [Brevibacillus borstelensis]
MLLQGKTAVITGCSRGIGKSILETFAQNGANIWACSRKPSEPFEQMIASLSKNYNVTITPLYFDLRSQEQVKEAMKTIFASKQCIDVLVNNAGMTSPNALFVMSSIDSMRELFETNFFSQMLITQYIARIMIKNKTGSIVNIASIAGMDGNPGQLEYVSSKAALIGATKKLADELAEHSIRVNGLAPGIVETDMIDRMSEEVLQIHLQKTKMKRLGQPSEIANAALFLASDLSSFITGQILRVDGGHY